MSIFYASEMGMKGIGIGLFIGKSLAQLIIYLLEIGGSNNTKYVGLTC